MSNQENKTREEFDAQFAEWEKVIQDPKIQLSSRPLDYINNKPYREIVKLGRDALPFVLEKIEQGVFFLNQAVLDISGMEMEEIIGKERRFASEQEKSRLLVDWWKAQKE